MPKNFKAAIVQAAPVLFDTLRTIAKVADRAREATELGKAELLVFPEAFVGGYPKGIGFGARLGMRAPKGGRIFRRYYESASELPSVEAARLEEIARDNGIHLVIGVIERAGGTLCDAASIGGPNNWNEK